MLELLCRYAPRDYTTSPYTTAIGRAPAPATKDVIVIVADLSSPDTLPHLLGVDRDGKFICDTIDRFTYIEKESL